MEQHKISEYIENLTFRKRVGGVDQEQVFEAIRELSSMYNELLMEAYEENENLKAMLEKEVKRNELRKEEKEETTEDETTMLAEVQPSALETQAKELRRLKRKDLLELLLEQSKENEDQRLLLAVQKKKILHLEERLMDKHIDIAEAGTMAEAALKLNGVFEAAQAAAQQYLDNLKSTDDRCAAMEAETKERCDALREETARKCAQAEADTKTKCELREKEAKEAVDKRWEELSDKLETFYTAHAGLKELLSATGDVLRDKDGQE